MKIFRITKIPEEFDQGRLSQMVVDVLGLRTPDFKVHSFASDVSYEGEPEWRVATISFRVRPHLLEESLLKGGKWSFALQSSPTDHSAPTNEAERIYFDLHFKGFTPLSPVQDDEKHEMEYDFL